MGLSVRDWMVIVGILLVVAVLLDGYRRMRHEWRNQIRMSLSRGGHRSSGDRAAGDTDPLDTAGPNSELPNGGARVIPRSERRRHERVEPSLGSPTSSSAAERASGTRPEPAAVRRAEPGSDAGSAPSPHPEKSSRPADGNNQIGEDRAADHPFGAPPQSASFGVGSTAAAEPTASQAGFDSEPEAESDRGAGIVDFDPLAVTPASRTGAVGQPKRRREDSDSADQAAEPWAVRQPVDAPARGRDPGEPDLGAAVRERQASGEAPSLGPADEVLVINVLAKDRPFAGAELLQILLTCDLRFGKMNIFHRYEQAGGKGPLQFSVANIVEPGVFDLDRIDDFTTRGVCFFMTLPGPREPLVAFNYMVETAQCLVRNLNGELRDEAHSVMTAQTLEHCRARIREFERRQLTRQHR